MRCTNGFLRKSPSGKWVGVLKYRDPEGEWRQVTKTLSADREESELMLAQWRGRMSGGAGAGARGAGPTVEEAVRSCLAAQLARGGIERSTHDAQLACAQRYLFPDLGGTDAGSLRARDIQAWSDRLCLRVSTGTARIALSALGKALARLERDGEIDASPMPGVEPPARPAPSRAYLPDGACALLEEALDSEWGPSDPRSLAARLALHAGLRAGECCGLRWRDVGEGCSRIRVSAAVGRTASGCYLKGPKNPTSAREFPVVPLLRDALAARRELDGGGGEPDGSWFCCGAGASFEDPRRLSDAFSALAARAGVRDSEGRRATFHVLRHTFATRAVRAGVDVRTLADMLGHADARMTLNVYAGSGDEAKLAAVARLEAAGRWGAGPG